MLDKILKIQKIIVMCFVIVFMSQFTYDNADQIYSNLKTTVVERVENVENFIKKAKKALNKWIFKI